MEETGYTLLQDPHKNKGTAFSLKERNKYRLHGLLPTTVETIETQLLRINEQVDHFAQPINKYVYLLQLLDNNETLFYKTIMNDPVKFMPLVYTLTVGEACMHFGHILRRPRGMYVSIKDKDNIKEILKNWPQKDVRFTVVTDGERVLGLGDLGVSGIGICIGKLCLYTACACVPPEYTLPIVLDLGTNNDELLNDPLYPGLKTKRIRGREFDDFIDAFVKAINEVFPKICIQWEDFAGSDAIRILHKYKDSVCTFNDDIQGTASVINAGFLTAARFSGVPIGEHRFLFLGAGAAAVGIADLLAKVIMQYGLSREEAYNKFWLFDRHGLVTKSRNDLADYKLPFARDYEFVSDFLEAIHLIKPTAIIGVSTIKSAFNQKIIEAMSELNKKPIIFACSNPTSHSECTAEEAYKWSDGRAIFASGSPFEPVELKGKTYYPGQGNNVFIFPAIGLAVLATQAKRVSDEMFIVASHALSELITDEDLSKGLIFPPIKNILEVALKVALSVAEYIFDNGLAGVQKPQDLESFIICKMYHPDYNLNKN
ncbi:MAG: NAD-dependent malic enzyme [Chlorobi bacterium]|nr:NAD-dependent malic enzyme [Chlorobiota bacterium]MCI0716281.1 NAD-dependent malic enzyme [Chlorobiota bacterium]